MNKTISVLLSLCILFGCSKPPKEVLVNRVVKESAQDVDDHIKKLEGKVMEYEQQLSNCQKKCADGTSSDETCKCDTMKTEYETFKKDSQ